MTSNCVTLRSYEAFAAAYVQGTSHTLIPPAKEWIDTALGGLDRGARILEIGSAFGRDAAYMASLGYDVECSDAAESFIRELGARGFKARKLNILTDDIGKDYDLIIANAVLLHFTCTEFALAAEKVRRALADNGLFAFTMKAGEGEEWSNEKLGAPRYFCYWRSNVLRRELDAAGFDVRSLDEVATGRAHSEWLYVVARPRK